MVISEITKKVLKHIYRGREETSAREAKELIPIANLIKRLVAKAKKNDDEEIDENTKEKEVL